MSWVAFVAVVPAGATPYFFVFWKWFEFWRRHQIATYVMMLGTFVVLGAAIYVERASVFAARIAVPMWAVAFGWIVIASATLLGFVADRQIGLRVRSFTPFFETAGRIELVTTGAYGIVRHPIYAAGIGFQIGAWLVTGALAIVPATIVLALGAVWFTRQEERRLVALLADPSAYERYRARVPALLPRLRRAR